MKCIYCGLEFDVQHARRSIGHKYGAGTYDEYAPNADICKDCVDAEVASDYQAGENVIKLMGPAPDLYD